MDVPHAQVPLDQKLPRVRENESMLAWDETNRTTPIEGRTTPPAADPQDLPAGWQDIKDGTPQSGNAVRRVQKWVADAWDVYRTKPWSMYFFLVTGTLFALGHHLFYLHLQGKEAKNQSRMLRYGTVLAFCAKASLSTAIVIAFQQRAWMVVRRKMVRLETADSIFTANRDFSSLFDWAAVKKAKVATCLAMYIWVAPLIVVLTSETLFAVAGTMEEATRCPSVRTLNFANLETLNWRQGNATRSSLSTFNATSLDSIGTDADFGPNAFDYYHSYSMRLEILAERAVNLRQAATREDTALEVCANGWNCSYVVNFIAPGYKCEELASGVGSKVKKLGGAEAPFGTEVLAPIGNYTYIADVSRGDYTTQQVESGIAGEPNQKPPYPKNLGVFRTEPIIWIGHATVNDSSIHQPDNSTMPGWYDAYTPVIFGCEHHEVNYTVAFNFTRGAQTYDIKHREYLRKVVNTTYLPDKKDPDRRLLDRTKATPEENYVYPQDFKNYRRIAAYHSIGRVLTHYLDGTIGPNNFTVSNLFNTGLLTQPNLLPVDDLQKAIEKLHEDILISIFSDPSFAVVSWAFNGMPTDNQRGGPSTSYPCVRQRIATFFVYNKTQLLTVYAASVALAFVGVLLGLQAVREEGVMRDMKPSSIIAGDRALSLHQLLSITKSDDKNVDIGYGVIQEPAGVASAAESPQGDRTQGRPQLQRA